MQTFPNHLFLKSKDTNQETHQSQLGAILECVASLENAGFDVPVEAYRNVAINNMKGRFVEADSDSWNASYGSDPSIIAFKHPDGSWAHIYCNSAEQKVVTVIYGHFNFEEAIAFMPDWVNSGNG